MTYFKDVAHHYGMSYDEMELIGDAAVWEFIMWNENCEGSK